MKNNSLQNQSRFQWCHGAGHNDSGHTDVIHKDITHNSTLMLISVHHVNQLSPKSAFLTLSSEPSFIESPIADLEIFDGKTSSPNLVTVGLSSLTAACNIFGTETFFR